jgi:hypothetical protein
MEGEDESGSKCISEERSGAQKGRRNRQIKEYSESGDQSEATTVEDPGSWIESYKISTLACYTSFLQEQ